VVTKTFVYIPLVKIHQRFGNATTGTGKTREHFKGTKRLVCFQVMVTIIEKK